MVGFVVGACVVDCFVVEACVVAAFVVGACVVASFMVGRCVADGPVLVTVVVIDVVGAVVDEDFAVVALVLTRRSENTHLHFVND